MSIVGAPPVRDNYPVNQEGFAVIPQPWLKWFSLVTSVINSKVSTSEDSFARVCSMPNQSGYL